MANTAIGGGESIRKAGSYHWPIYGEEEKIALDRVLQSGIWGTLGPEAEALCSEFAAYMGARYALAVTNGTVTMEIILRALEIGLGDEVIIPSYTFIATSSAVLAAGATPVFCDIDENSFNMDPAQIEPLVTPRTKAIIPVHIGGNLCDMDAIGKIANRHGLYVIEDAAHAHGSEWKGQRAGTLGIAGSFSMQGSKTLSAGEGGMIVTNDRDLYHRCFSVHHCGRDAVNPDWYDHPYLGTNARMTEWQAAVLRQQLRRLDNQIETRMKNAALLDTLLESFDFIETVRRDERVTRNGRYLYVFGFLPQWCRGLTRDMFFKALCAEGIPAGSGFPALYTQALFDTGPVRRITGNRSYKGIQHPVCERVVREKGMWIAHQALLGSEEDTRDITKAIEKIYDNADEIIEILHNESVVK